MKHYILLAFALVVFPQISNAEDLNWMDLLLWNPIKNNINQEVDSFSLDRNMGRMAITVDYREQSPSMSDAQSIGVYFIHYGSIGGYLNYQSDTQFNSPEFSSGDIFQVRLTEDKIIKTYRESDVLNLGATFNFNPNLTIYGGVGIVNQIDGQKRFDATRSVSADGEYFLLFDNDPHVKGNINLGVLFSLGRLVLNAGYQSTNESTYFGIGFAF